VRIKDLKNVWNILTDNLEYIAVQRIENISSKTGFVWVTHAFKIFCFSEWPN